jgi:acetyl-CoA synthetase
LKLRAASSAGEPLTPEVNQWAEETFGILVHDHYGQTEVSMVINNHHHPSTQRLVKTGSMGHAMPGWSVAVLKMAEDALAPIDEPGRLALNFNHSALAWFPGYADEPTKTAEKFTSDGRWYLTGDTARIDSEDYIYFSSRDDDVIIMAGYRIGPFEVESVIATHPSVSECAVIAAPDATRGEVLEAFVVLKSDLKPTSELADDIQQWVKSKYAAHAYPRRVHFAESLPKTPSGKIQRFVLRQRRREEINAATVPAGG